MYAVTGDSSGNTVSHQIQNIFRRDDEADFQINWAGSNYFHASHSPQEETIRWFVTIQGERLPRHAIAYGYTTKSWWIEEHPFPVLASALGREAGGRFTIRSGSEQVFYGSDGARVMASSQNAVDNVVKAKAIHGTVTAAEDFTITDSAKSFDQSYLNTTVAIVDGLGMYQVRRIVEVSGSKLRFDRPFPIRPRPGDKYQIGGVTVKMVSHQFRFLRSETKAASHAEVNYIPVSKGNAQVVRVGVVHDYQEQQKAKARTMDKSLRLQQQSEDGYVGQIIPIDGSGYEMFRYDRWAELQQDVPKTMQMMLTGVSGPEPIRVRSILMAGITR